MASLPFERCVAIFSSDLQRARHTAAPLAAATGLSVHRDARLRERALGSYEGLPLATLTSDVSGIADGVIVDPTAAAAGMESLEQVYARCAEFLAELVSTQWDGDVAIVTHGGALRMLRAAALRSPLPFAAWDLVPNTYVERLQFSALGRPDLPQPTHQPNLEDVP